MKDRNTFLVQTGLKSLGFDPGEIDGDLGPFTLAALSAFDASLKQPAAESKLAALLVARGVGQRHVIETSKNQGPGILKFWGATTYPEGYDNREPWCAAFVCWCLREALSELSPASQRPTGFNRLTSPVAYDAETWAASMKGKGVLLLDPKIWEIRPGDIVTLSVSSHIVIATKGRKTTFDTVEGNTNEAGSREGDGVYFRSRPRSHARKIIRFTF